ncbi:hypothetical protein [Dysgonomonas massiliensis]|uniref:hypothetical protein n=1 Tax=Dysgonomonas massiliensis TaxID=2040292 RepID=UPI0011AF1190|nr:hypothetical protein [Dysgonomonas massiliensis]
MKRSFIISLLVLIWFNSCSEKIDPTLLYLGDSERIMKIENVMEEPLGQGKAEYVYDNNNRLINASLKFEGELGTSSYHYNYSYGNKKIFITGSIKIAPSSDEVMNTNRDVDIELILNNEGKVTRKIDRKHPYNSEPVIDNFIWDGSKLMKVERTIKGVREVDFLETLEQYYEGDNIVMQIVKTKSMGITSIMQGNDTTNYTYSLGDKNIQAPIYKLASLRLDDIRTFAAYSSDVCISNRERKYTSIRNRETDNIEKEIIYKSDYDIVFLYEGRSQYVKTIEKANSSTLIKSSNDSTENHSLSTRSNSIFYYRGDLK